MPTVQTLAAASHSELLIKKSRFLGCVQPMGSRKEAQQVVASLWAVHPGAAHVCWALLAGDQSAAVDDGEPSGTAGRPMLDVLRHQGLEGVLATVVRYYGGVRLGAGGLVRAYTDSVAQALLGATKIAIVRTCVLRCTFPYALEGLVRRELELAGAVLQAVQHGQEVEMAFQITEDATTGLRQRLGGSGRVIWLEDGSESADDTDA
jgi:uncharacterized YigZ family protein